jgi:hypothetical protein
MSEFHKPLQQYVMTHNAMSSESETGQLTMMPPPFQLKASGNPPSGNPKKKGVPPTNDHPVSVEDRKKVRPKPIPAEIIREIKCEVKGMEQLEICADIIIVHSPCYSAEIYAIMDMVNKGEMDYEKGKQEILDRLTYLILNEFKNADGEVNNWAETNKGDGTVQNEGNMGAEWYQMGKAGGPQFIALTDWNNPADPSQGAKNYAVFRYNPPVEGEEGPERRDPFRQGGGIPFTSKSGGGKGDTKADHTEESENIDILMWILTLLGASGTGAKTISDKSKTVGSGTPALHDMSDDPRKETDEEKKKREKEEKEKAEREKGINTLIDVSIFEPGQNGNGVVGGTTLSAFMRQHFKDHPKGTRFVVTKSSPNNKNQAYYSKMEVQAKINDAVKNIKE